jgi:hypothetical protein
MSTDAINSAYSATSTIEDQIIEVCLMIRNHSINRLGVYHNPALVQDDLRKGAKKLLELEAFAKDVQWPKAADYAEV